MSDQTLAGLEAVGDMLALYVRVAREEFEVRRFVALVDIEHAVLRLHDRGELGEDHA